MDWKKLFANIAIIFLCILGSTIITGLMWLLYCAIGFMALPGIWISLLCIFVYAFMVLYKTLSN